MRFQAETAPDPQEWDDFVSSHASGHFMQSQAWGRFQSNSGWEPHYCTFRSNKRLQGVALLLARKVPGTLLKIFYSPRGPVTDFTNYPATDHFLTSLSEYIAENKGIFLRCDPYATDSGRQLPPSLRSVRRDWSYWNSPKLVLWLDLNGDEDAVMSRMTSRCRNDVRRGYKNNVQFSVTSGDESISEFYRLMIETGQHKGIAVRSLDYYKKLFSVVGSSANLRLFLGRHAGRVITAGVSVVYGKKAWLLYAASSPDSYKLRANRTLQWEMIKWAHSQGCSRYDFRGTATSDPPRTDDPGYGVYEFKKSFGPEYTRLAGYYDLVNCPLIYKAFRLGEEHLLPTAYRLRTWLGDRGVL